MLNYLYIFYLAYNTRFMDAEIGVRDLADSFRYNVLPDIITALGLTRDKLHGDIEVFEDLPEYEKLSMLVCNFDHGGAAIMSNCMLLSHEPKQSLTMRFIGLLFKQKST